MDNLVAVLQGCSSVSRAERSAAEAALTQAQLSPGAAPALLRLAADRELAAPQVAQAAAIALKNLVKGRWVASGSTAAANAAAAAAADPSSAGGGGVGGALPEADKAAVRDNLFEALALAPSPLVRSQVAEVVKVVAGHDFPARWPGLAAAVAAALNPAAGASPDQLLGAFLLASSSTSSASSCSSPEALILPRLHAALVALRALCRQYEFRDRGEDGPLAALVSETFPQLLLVARSAAALCGATTRVGGGLGGGGGGGEGNGHAAAAAAASPSSASLPSSSLLQRAAPISDQLGELVKLALKCFWSACYMGIPTAMMTATVTLQPGGGGGGSVGQHQQQLLLIDGWLELIHDLVRGEVPLPLDVPAASSSSPLKAPSYPPDPLRDPETAAEWPWWKARKWALHVASRLSSRYGDPRTFQPSSIGTRSGSSSREASAAAAALERKFAEGWAAGSESTGGGGGGGGVGERFLRAVLEGPLASAGAYFHAEAEAAASGTGHPPPPELLRRHWVSPRALNLALKYVERAVQLAAPWRSLKPHAAALVRAVALPAAAFDDADEELWEGDPAEFVRRSNDVMVELYSPRAAAVSFVVSLCRQRPATALAPTLEALGAALQQHLVLQSQQAAQQAAAQQRAPPSFLLTTRHVERRADGALLLAGSLADTLKRKRAYAPQVEPLLRGVVLPLFASPRGHLRARACWVAGQFADAELSQAPAAADGPSSSSSSSSCAAPDLKTGTGPVFDALFDAVVGSLGDRELPVRIDAAVALRSLVEAAASSGDDEEPGSAASRTDARVSAALPDLLRTLLQLMAQVDNEDLVSALEALVERAGPGVAPFAAELTRELVAAFNRMAPPPLVPSVDAVDGTGLAAGAGAASNGSISSVVFDTATKDTADDRDDEAAMAAFSVLRALLTIIDAVSGVPGAVQSIEPHLLPLVARLVSGMGDEAPDVFEEGLDLLAFLTYHSPAISRDLWGLWPETVQAFDSWAGEAYLENMYPPLSNLIRRDTETFVAGRNPRRGNRPFVDDLVAMASTALLGSGRGNDDESVNAPGTPGGGDDSDDSDDENNSGSEYDLIDDFEEVIPAARLLSVALQSCGAFRRERVAAGTQTGGDAAAAAAAAAAVAQALAPIDAALPAIVHIAVDRLQGLKKKKRDKATGQVTERRGPPPPKPLREALLRVVADALSYDAAAALGAIGAATGAGAEGVAKFFEIWITLATATKSDGGKKKTRKTTGSGDGGGGAAAAAGAAAAPALENFRKAGDKKSAVLGLAAALAAPPGSLPPAVEAGAGHVLSAALGLLSAWKEQRAARSEEGEEGGGGGGRGGRMLPGWGGGASDDDDDDGGHGGDHDEDEDGDADVYVRRLAAAAARRAAKVAAGGGGSDDDDSDDSDDSDDDDWGSDDDEDATDDDEEAHSPLASVDPRAALLSSVNAARQLGRLAGIEHDAGMRGALEALAAEVAGAGGGSSRPSSA